MQVTECDNCRKIGPQPAPGWVMALEIQPQEPSFLAALGGSNGGYDVAGTFCGWRCVAEYATSRALIPGSPPT